LKKEDKFNGSEKQTPKKPKKCNKTSKNKWSSMPRKGNTKWWKINSEKHVILHFISEKELEEAKR
jgi:hypothetical protein